MKTVLVTGGSGVFGRALTPLLVEAGYEVRIMSRRSFTGTPENAIHWVQADLNTGEGITEAVEGAHYIIHAASNPMQTKTTDIQGTETLLAAASRANIEKIIYISIIGIDKIPFRYYQTKVAVEEMIKASGLPWAILRATQFHNLVDMFLGGIARLPIMPVPTGFQLQTVDPSEVAQLLVEQLKLGATGYLPSITGPERITSGEMARQWLAARGQRRWRLPLYLPGKVASGFRAGYTTEPAEVFGKITWAEWLAHTSSHIES